MDLFDKLIQKGQSLIKGTKGLDRDYEDILLESIGSKPIKVVTGFRRSGKSFLLRKIAKKLISKKIYTATNVLYLNFEDIELDDYKTAKDIKKLFDYFTKKSKSKFLILFDEIQLIEDWSKLIRTIYEFHPNCELVLTGSNSELLSSEIGSNLAGRFIEFQILPFSFKEYLAFHDLLPSSRKELWAQAKEIYKAFDDYTKYGGLPETFSISSIEAKQSYLEGIISKVILDDVIKRFKIRSPVLIEKILQYLLMNIGNPVSFTKIETFCTRLGFNTKLDTVIDYVSHLQKCFALTELSRFDWKTRKIFDTNKKFYAVDPGLSFLYSNSNLAKRVENIVYLELIRYSQKADLYYSLGEGELDFVRLRKDRHIDKFQVTLELNDENYERETQAFVTSDIYLNTGTNILLTLKDKSLDLTISEPDLGDIHIQQINLLEFLVLQHKV